MIRTIILALLVLAPCLPALAQGPPEGPPKGFKTNPESATEPAWTLGSGRTLWLVPAGAVYPVYLADPHKPESSVQVHFYTRVGVYDSTSVRNSRLSPTENAT